MASLRVSPTKWRAACSQFRTLPPGSWRAIGDAIISPVLRQLHWLPVRQCVMFKHRICIGGAYGNSVVQDFDSRLPVLVRQRPGYLVDDCQLVADARVRQLRSTDTQTLVVSRTRSSFGDRTFAAAARTTSLEQSAAQSHTMWAVVRPVHAVTEDILTVRTWRSANCF